LEFDGHWIRYQAQLRRFADFHINSGTAVTFPHQIEHFLQNSGTTDRLFIMIAMSATKAARFLREFYLIQK